MKQTKAQKKVVRKILYFLSKNEYESGYNCGRTKTPLKLHKCDSYIDDYSAALCRKGVVLAYGGGCIIDRFALYKAPTLQKLLNAAKKAAKKKGKK